MDIKTLFASAAISAVLTAVAVPLTVTYVTLQATTPGVTETGHVNISGTVKSSKVAATSASGNVITGIVNTTGRGVYGAAYASDGLTYGVHGAATGARGIGVYGSSDLDIGVKGFGGNTGGDFYSQSGRGVNSTGHIGGYFSSSSTTGTGARINSTAATGSTYGAYILNSSSSGKAIFGLASGSSGLTFGGQFYVVSPTGTGVAGYASGSGVTYGVHGTATSGSGYGVWAQGRSGASGTKSFRIDHPLDPENRYLVHYSAEGPEPLNLYRGSVTTNAKGEAWVTLPSYYAEINLNPTYHLTVIDGEDSEVFVQVKVAKKLSGNRFKIRSSRPNVEVCWEVKAIRNDRWVRQNGAPVEPLKEGVERGRYLHPELYGQPESMAAHPDPMGAGASGASSDRRN